MRARAVTDAAIAIVQDWYRTGDPALLAPEIEWRVLETFPCGGLYRGKRDVLDRFFPAVRTLFASYETQAETFLGDGGTVITTGQYRVRGKTGHVGLAAFAHVWTVQKGTIRTFRQIADTAGIMDALGQDSQVEPTPSMTIA